jgi:hypothetical protein
MIVRALSSSASSPALRACGPSSKVAQSACPADEVVELPAFVRAQPHDRLPLAAKSLALLTYGLPGYFWLYGDL